MRARGRWAFVAASLVALALIGSALAATAGHRTAQAKKPIIIGWAFDSTGAMKPFDTPALAAAQLQVAKVNAKGGVGGRKLQIRDMRYAGERPRNREGVRSAPARTEGQRPLYDLRCRLRRTGGARRRSTEASLRLRRVIGTDQMGPKRFGPKGRLAFSSATSHRTRGRPWPSTRGAGAGKQRPSRPTRSSSTSRTWVQAFDVRFKQLGGKIVANETYQSLGGNNVQNAVSRLNNVKADVIVTSTAGAFGALSPFITGLRTLGNNTPVLNSWAGDGTYWLPTNPKVSNYWFVTFASCFGDDPSKAVNALAKKVGAGTGGFITGPSAIDGLVVAIKRAHGSTKGITLAKVMEKFKNVPTISGNVNFSRTLHTVFGRRYRIIRIQDNVPKVVGTIVAKKVPKI